MFIDSHFHIDCLDPASLGAILARTLEAEVALGISAGVWLETLPKIFSLQKNTQAFDLISKTSPLQLSPSRFSVFFSHGLHPQEIHTRWFDDRGIFQDKTAEKDLTMFWDDLASHENHIWAIGETGFDFSREIMSVSRQKMINKDSLLEAQKLAFRTCIMGARKYSLPLVIHSREAFKLTIDTLFAEIDSTTKILFHCYGGSLEELKKLAKSPQIFFSFNGVATWPTAHKIRHVLAGCPINSLLVETDSPFLSLAREGRSPPNNSPENIRLLVKYFANYRNENEAQLSSHILSNALLFLGIKTGLYESLAGKASLIS